MGFYCRACQQRIMISLHRQIRIAGDLADFPPLQLSPGGGEGRIRAGLVQLEG